MWYFVIAFHCRNYFTFSSQYNSRITKWNRLISNHPILPGAGVVCKRDNLYLVLCIHYFLLQHLESLKVWEDIGSKWRLALLTAQPTPRYWIGKHLLINKRFKICSLAHVSVAAFLSCDKTIPFVIQESGWTNRDILMMEANSKI